MGQVRQAALNFGDHLLDAAADGHQTPVPTRENVAVSAIRRPQPLRDRAIG